MDYLGLLPRGHGKHQRYVSSRKRFSTFFAFSIQVIFVALHLPIGYCLDILFIHPLSITYFIHERQILFIVTLPPIHTFIHHFLGFFHGNRGSRIPLGIFGTRTVATITYLTWPDVDLSITLTNNTTSTPIDHDDPPGPTLRRCGLSAAMSSTQARQSLLNGLCPCSMC